MKISTRQAAEIIDCSNKTIIKYVKMFYTDKVSRCRQITLTLFELRIVLATIEQARKNRFSKSWNFESVENLINENLVIENDERQVA